MDTDLQQQLTNVSRGLVAIGGLNWGLVGLFDLDLVATLFGARSPLARVVYTAVGAATVYTVVNAVRTRASSTPTSPDEAATVIAGRAEQLATQPRT